MSNNIFYKALAAVSTVGIVVIAGIQVTTALKKSNTAEDQLAKTMIEIKNARKDALSEVKAIRSDLVKELNNIRSNTLNEIKVDRSNALNEVKAARKEALSSIGQASGEEVKVWLVLKYGGREDVPGLANVGGFTFSLDSIPMKDIDTCEVMGAQWISSPRAFEGRYNYERVAFACLEE